MNDTHGNDTGQNDERMPSTDELEEPSTEKQPEEEPKADAAAEPEPSHEAVGIGVIGGELVDPDSDSDPDHGTE